MSDSTTTPTTTGNAVVDDSLNKMREASTASIALSVTTNTIVTDINATAAAVRKIQPT